MERENLLDKMKKDELLWIIPVTSYRKISLEHVEGHISQATSAFQKNEGEDYSFVQSISRVDVYDDMRMPPRVLEIQPAPTAEYIEKLSDVIDEQKRRLGGSIPYTAIREVAENFIHAHFNELKHHSILRSRTGHQR